MTKRPPIGAAAVRYVDAWRYDSRHVHILTIVILGGVPVPVG
jgi:hypothetical protein